MDDFDLDHVSNIFIELIHQEIHVEQVIELPAFSDHWITQDVPELDSLIIISSRDGDIPNIRELNRGRNEFGLTSCGVRVMFAFSLVLVS